MSRRKSVTLGVGNRSISSKTMRHTTAVALFERPSSRCSIQHEKRVDSNARSKLVHIDHELAVWALETLARLKQEHSFA